MCNNDAMKPHESKCEDLLCCGVDECFIYEPDKIIAIDNEAKLTKRYDSLWGRFVDQVRILLKDKISEEHYKSFVEDYKNLPREANDHKIFDLMEKYYCLDIKDKREIYWKNFQNICDKDN